MKLKLIFIAICSISNLGFAQVLTVTPNTQRTLEEDLEKPDEEQVVIPPRQIKSPSDKNGGKAQGTNTSWFSQDPQYAIKGLSIGAVTFTQSYTSSVAIVLDGATKRVANKGSDLFYLGGMLRYSVFPYEKLGTDLAVTVASSINHGSVNYDPSTYMKAELNFGYSWLTKSFTPVYSFVGFGYENVKCKSLEYLTASGGSSIQVGIGANYARNISIEGVYSISRRTVAPYLYELLEAQALGQGFTDVDFETNKSYVTSNLFQLRALFRF